MIQPTKADIGRKVIYRDLSGSKIEEGIITSFNDYCVFVRYKWSGTTSAGTRREDLEWMTNGDDQRMTNVWQKHMKNQMPG